MSEHPTCSTSTHVSPSHEIHSYNITRADMCTSSASHLGEGFTPRTMLLLLLPSAAGSGHDTSTEIRKQEEALQQHGVRGVRQG
eukprot:3138445-Prymnesium_polylepis.1